MVDIYTNGGPFVFNEEGSPFAESVARCEPGDIPLSGMFGIDTVEGNVLRTTSSAMLIDETGWKASASGISDDDRSLRIVAFVRCLDVT
ncbi:MAG: hypothetical protein AB7V56_09440 [Candidatus Nitrosocosmicus sp.]